MATIINRKTHLWPYSTEVGDFDLELTKKDILDCSHEGICDADCERVAQQEYVQKQLQDVSNEAMPSSSIICRHNVIGDIGNHEYI